MKMRTSARSGPSIVRSRAGPRYSKRSPEEVSHPEVLGQRRELSKDEDQASTLRAPPWLPPAPDGCRAPLEKHRRLDGGAAGRRPAGARRGSRRRCRRRRPPYRMGGTWRPWRQYHWRNQAVDEHGGCWRQVTSTFGRRRRTSARHPIGDRGYLASAQRFIRPFSENRLPRPFERVRIVLDRQHRRVFDGLADECQIRSTPPLVMRKIFWQRPTLGQGVPTRRINMPCATRPAPSAGRKTGGIEPADRDPAQKAAVRSSAAMAAIRSAFGTHLRQSVVQVRHVARFSVSTGGRSGSSYKPAPEARVSRLAGFTDNR